MYFVPAISNIRGNLGQGSVNEEHVRELCRTMLDEAKHLYLNSPLSRSDSPFNAASDTSTLIESRFGNSQDDTDEDKVNNPGKSARSCHFELNYYVRN